MSENTMQLAVITPEAEPTGEMITVDETSSHRWRLFTPRPERKHRIHDFVERLKRDLRRSESLNEELREMIRAKLNENEELRGQNKELQDRVNELREQLKVASEANRVNALGVDFRFAQRPIDGPEDQATMPVPQVELLSDEELRPVAADAATALLDRVVPKTTLAIEPPAETKVLPAVTTPTHGNATLDPFGLNEDEDDGEDDEPEVYNSTSNGWQVRRPEPVKPVTWGRSALSFNASTTGTFQVTSLQARGTTPSSIPGLHLRTV